VRRFERVALRRELRREREHDEPAVARLAVLHRDDVLEAQLVPEEVHAARRVAERELLEGEAGELELRRQHRPRLRPFDVQVPAPHPGEIERRDAPPDRGEVGALRFGVDEQAAVHVVVHLKQAVGAGEAVVDAAPPSSRPSRRRRRR
jgi:hypothetical protein